MFVKGPEQAASFCANAPPQLVSLLEQFIVFSREQALPDPLVTGFDREPAFYVQNGLKVPSFSWHLVRCAIDLRTHHYTDPQLKLVETWFQQKCRPTHDWEVITELHGTGPHIHIGYRDRQRRSLWLDMNINPRAVS